MKIERILFIPFFFLSFPFQFYFISFFSRYQIDFELNKSNLIVRVKFSCHGKSTHKHFDPNVNQTKLILIGVILWGSTYSLTT